MGQAGQDIDEHHGDAAGNQVGQGRRRTLVRHVKQIEAGKAGEGGARHDRRRTAAGIGVLARFLLGQRDQLGHRIRRNLGIDHQHEGQIAGPRDRREVLDRIVSHVLQQIRICRMRRIRRHEQRVAVRRGSGDITRRERAISARLIFDHDADAEGCAEFLRNDPCRGVGAAAGGERQHQRDGAVRVGRLRGCGGCQPSEGQCEGGNRTQALCR
jgi:hypothetical protein